MPGVSTNTNWAPGRCLTPRILVRVVCGLSEMMAILPPRIQFRSVDFPTFGRPTSATKPE